MSITTHVLDVARGLPAGGMGVLLSVRSGEGWRVLARPLSERYWL